MNGPVQHLRTVLWYLDMELTSDLRIHRDGRVPFQWLEQQDGWWGHELREHVRQSLVADVQTRVTKEQPDRKDMQDLTTQLDFDACRALLLGKTYPGSSRPSQYSQQESDTPRNPAEAAGEPLSGLERHRLKTILTGSVRTNHRLAAAGIIESPGCNFCAGCTREDHEHLFWHCPGPGGAYKRIRDHWFPLAQQVQAKMVQCVNFFEIRCLRHHGLLPADPRFAQAWDKIPQVDESDPEPPDVDPGGLSDRWVQSGYEIVITDGATARQENHILRRSGFGLFYGMGDPRNSSDPLATFSQQPYRAELRAVLRAFRWARWPTWVWLDNAAVVHVVNQMLQGNHRCPSVQGDLWVRMVELIREAPVDFFRCSWKKGHATDEIIAAGVLTREEAARQAKVVVAQRQIPTVLVLKTIEILQLQFFDDVVPSFSISWTRVLTCPLLCNDSAGVTEQKTVEVPQLQLYGFVQFLDRLLTCPSSCNVVELIVACRATDRGVYCGVDAAFAC